MSGRRLARGGASRLAHGSRSCAHPLPQPGELFVRTGLVMDGYHRSEETLTELTPTQSAYLGVPVEGPYKPDHYRY